jgi:hypothetical protein
VIELVGGARGVFDVKDDEGKVVFSKHREGRFPTPPEIVQLLS